MELRPQWDQYRDLLQRFGWLDPNSTASGSWEGRAGGIMHLGVFRDGTGISQFEHALIDGLAARGIPQVVVGCGRWPGSDDVAFVPFDALVPGEDSVGSWRAIVERVTECARASGAQMLMCHREFPLGAMGMEVKRALGIPTVVFTYGFQSSIEMMQQDGRALAEALGGMDRFIAVSKSLGRIAKAGLGLDDEVLELLRGGYDPALFFPAENSPEPEHRPLRVLFVGRLSRDKGPDVFVEAVAEAHEAGVLLEAEVIGYGPLRPALEERIAALGLPSVITLTGYQPLARFAERLRRSDVLVVPSRYEGLGTQTVDALATGIPVIASRAGGLVELMEESKGGVLVDPEAPAQVAEQLRRLGEEPELRRRLGESGRRFCRQQRLDWDGVVEHLLRCAVQPLVPSLVPSVCSMTAGTEPREG